MGVCLSLCNTSIENSLGCRLRTATVAAQAILANRPRNFVAHRPCRIGFAALNHPVELGMFVAEILQIYLRWPCHQMNVWADLPRIPEVFHFAEQGDQFYNDFLWRIELRPTDNSLQQGAVLSKPASRCPAAAGMQSSTNNPMIWRDIVGRDSLPSQNDAMGAAFTEIYDETRTPVLLPLNVAYIHGMRGDLTKCEKLGRVSHIDDEAFRGDMGNKSAFDLPPKVGRASHR